MKNGNKQSSFLEKTRGTYIFDSDRLEYHCFLLNITLQAPFSQDKNFSNKEKMKKNSQQQQKTELPQLVDW